MAPEALAGAPGDAQGDVFALGVTLYRMFAGAYPYGEIEPFQRPNWKAPTPLQQRRPDLPGWLDLVLSRAIAIQPQSRPGDALELALELEAGAASRPGPHPPAAPAGPQPRPVLAGLLPAPGPVARPLRPPAPLTSGIVMAWPGPGHPRRPARPRDDQSGKPGRPPPPRSTPMASAAAACRSAR